MEKALMDELAVTQALPMHAGKGPPLATHAERILHTFLEAAPDAVVIVDHDGTMVQVNAQTERLFGYARAALLGQPIEMLLPERFRARHVEHRQAYLADPRPRSMGNHFELLGLRKDGQEFPVDVSLSPLPGSGERLVASAIRDMTAYRRLEAELRRQAADLEDADRFKDQFLTTLAHELRSPLAAIAQSTEVLSQADTTADARDRALRVVQRQTRHMLRLVGELGDLSRIRRGEVTVRMEPTDLAQVVHQAVESSQPLIEERRQSLQIQLPPGTVWVRGNATRLVQVVANLLTNAARYTPESGRIALSVACEGALAVVRVKDSGIGIPKEMLTRVFELFTRLESGKQASDHGLGIGLALVRQLVETHGGGVEALSQGAGQGSEFVVRLPLLKQDPVR